MSLPVGGRSAVITEGDARSEMRVLWCLAFVFGVSLGAQERWNLEKTRQCSCSSNATTAFLSGVSKTCITDAQGRRVRLRLSPSEDGCCTAKVVEKTPPPGEIYIRLTYNGKLRGALLAPADPAEVQYVLQLDVDSGNLYDPADRADSGAAMMADSPRNPDANRRKRDSGAESGELAIMPFSTVTFTITLKMDKEPDCDLEDLIEGQLRKGVAAFWLKMTNCLLDVTE